jgi:hypothetical protein
MISLELSPFSLGVNAISGIFKYLPTVSSYDEDYIVAGKNP